MKGYTRAITKKNDTGNFLKGDKRKKRSYADIPNGPADEIKVHHPNALFTNR
jgi:hypothetical protein